MVFSSLGPAMRRALRDPPAVKQLMDPWWTATWQPSTGAQGYAKAAAVAGSKKGVVASKDKEGAAGGKGKGKKGAVTEKERNLRVLEEAVKVLVSPKGVKVDPSEVPEDIARAKLYSSRKMAEHRKLRAAESMRLKLKLAAIDALPAGKLRLAAMVPDYTPFPANRIAAALSPPMLGFIEEQARESERIATVKKIR